MLMFIYPVLFIVLCLVSCETEKAPVSSLTKFRDLTFFNNLVHFVGENGPEGGLNSDHIKTPANGQNPQHPGYGQVPNSEQQMGLVKNPGYSEQKPDYGGQAPEMPQNPRYPQMGQTPNYYQQPGFQPNPGYVQNPGYNPNPGYVQTPGYVQNPEYSQNPAYSQNPSRYPKQIQPSYPQERPRKQRQRYTDPEYEGDLGAGRKDSQQRNHEIPKNTKPEDNGANSESPPKTVMSATGVKLEVNKQQKITYNTEFTLSLKWRPANTAKSITKMLLYFPKKIEQTAFNSWETLRGGSSKAYKVVRDSARGPVPELNQPAPPKSENPDESEKACEGGNCVDTPIFADPNEDQKGSNGGELGPVVGPSPEEEIMPVGEAPVEQSPDETEKDSPPEFSIPSESENSGSESEYDSDEDSGSESESDWTYEDSWNSIPSPNKHREPPENYPFFVRLSSYEPETEVTKELDLQISRDGIEEDVDADDSRTAKELAEEHDEKSEATMSEGLGPDQVDEPQSETSEKPESETSNELESQPSEPDHDFEALPEPEPEEEPEVEPAEDPIPIFRQEPVPRASSGIRTKSTHRHKRRHRPSYVLVDSDILVNTICPHMLSDFKSSPQQMGKKKLVSVKVSNTTALQPPARRDPPRFFPGDHVSKGSTLKSTLVTLAIGLFSSLVPL